MGQRNKQAKKVCLEKRQCNMTKVKFRTELVTNLHFSLNFATGSCISILEHSSTRLINFYSPFHSNY